MDEITTIKLRSSNLEGEYSQFEYDFGCFLTATELADYATLITEIFQYSPGEIREAIEQWNELKYERLIFKNEQRINGKDSTNTQLSDPNNLRFKGANSELEGNGRTTEAHEFKA